MAKLQNALNAGIVALVVLVVLFQAYATIVPSAQAAGSAMNDSNRCVAALNSTGSACIWDAATGCWENNDNTTTCTGNYTIPLGNLFDGAGVVFIIVMCALLIVAIRGFMVKGK